MEDEQQLTQRQSRLPLPKQKTATLQVPVHADSGHQEHTGPRAQRAQSRPSLHVLDLSFNEKCEGLVMRRTKIVNERNHGFFAATLREHTHWKLSVQRV